MTDTDDHHERTLRRAKRVRDVLLYGGMGALLSASYAAFNGAFEWWLLQTLAFVFMGSLLATELGVRYLGTHA